MLTCETAAPEQAERLAELSQRTNQCNLADKRYTKEQVESLLSDTGCLVLSLSVADKYGDMGIVGAAVVRLETAQAMIEAFFLSCRAFDRGFETVLLEEIKKRFSDRAVAGIYVPTGKNGHYSRFYEQNGVTSYAP